MLEEIVYNMVERAMLNSVHHHSSIPSHEENSGNQLPAVLSMMYADFAIGHHKYLEVLRSDRHDEQQKIHRFVSTNISDALSLGFATFISKCRSESQSFPITSLFVEGLHARNNSI